MAGFGGGLQIRTAAGSGRRIMAPDRQAVQAVGGVTRMDKQSLVQNARYNSLTLHQSIPAMCAAQR